MASPETRRVLDRLGLWPQGRGAWPRLGLGCEGAEGPAGCSPTQGCSLAPVLLTVPVGTLTPRTAQLSRKGALSEIYFPRPSLLKKKKNCWKSRDDIPQNGRRELRYLYTQVHGNFPHNCQKVEATLMSIRG